MSEIYKNVYFVTGGGTGGHIYPAIAVADALSQDSKVYYVGNRHNMEYELATRKGYKFVGWILQRNDDSKVDALGQGWHTEDEILASGYSKKTYANQVELTLDASWVRDNETAKSFTLYATWEISGVVYIDNGTALEPYLVYIDNVPMISSSRVVPASVWNAIAISRGTLKPFSLGFTLEPPLNTLTQRPRDI